MRTCSLDELVKKLWKPICHYIHPTISYNDIPKVELCDPYEDLENNPLSISILGRTWVEQRKIKIYLNFKRKFRLKTLVHELIHARGYISHNAWIGFYSEIELDTYTNEIIRKIGLNPDIIFKACKDNKKVYIVHE